MVDGDLVAGASDPTGRLGVTRLLCVSSLKEWGRSIPRKKLVWVLCAVPSVERAAVSPLTGSMVERPQRREDE